MKKRFKLDFGNLFFGILLVLLIIPQTRKPIQVAVNQLKMLVWSPSALDVEDQKQLVPFNYLLADLENQPRTLEIGKGKITFISYWATWCPPCVAELPSIEKLYADYGNEINFLLITNEDPTVVKRFLEKKGYELPIFKPRMQTPEKLFDESIPTNYLIDKNGKIRIKETGAADWNSEKVRAILQQLLNS